MNMYRYNAMIIMNNIGRFLSRVIVSGHYGLFPSPTLSIDLQDLAFLVPELVLLLYIV